MKRFLWATAAAGVLMAVFPWIFAYQGTLLGFSISLRALGDAAGIVLILFGLVVVASPRLQEKTASLTRELDALSSADRRNVKILLVSLYAIGVISHKLRAQYGLSTHAHDLGFFSNLCWNTSAGNFFYSSLYEVPFLGRHVNLILWPLSWFYKLGFGASVLLVAQALMIAVAAPLLWAIAERETGSFSWGLMVALMFVCSPFIGHLAANDFHPKAWFAPCLFAVIGAWQKKIRWQIFLFAAIMVLAEEDAPIALAGFAVFLMFDPEFRAAGAALFAASITVFLFYTQVLIPRFIEEGVPSMMFARYALGSSYKEWLMNLVFHPRVWGDAIAYYPAKYWRMFCMVLPTGGLAFLGAPLLLPAVIALAPHFLAHNELQLSLADIYALPAQPFIFSAAAVGLGRLLKIEHVRARGGLLAGIGLIVAGAGAYRSPKYFKNEPRVRLRAFHELKTVIPKDAALVAQQNLYPHFDTRRYIQLFPMGTTMAEFDKSHFVNPAYVICDKYGNPHPYSRDELEAAIRALQESGHYQLIAEREGFMIFKRTSDEPLRFQKAKPDLRQL